MKRNPATNEALCALAKQGDADAQNLLIENNLRFIRKTAYKLWNAQAELNLSLGIDPDDLIQEGMLGLCGCIEHYDPDTRNLFLTYAGPAIRNTMLDYIREGDTVIVESISRLARSTKDLLSIVEQITAKGAEFISLKERNYKVH